MKIDTLRGRGLHAAILAWCMLLAPSCRQSPDEPPERSAANSTPMHSVITLSVAASTRDVVAALADRYKQLSDDEIRINTGASSALANQIIAGAPVDVFLSASTQWAQKVDEAGLADRSVKLLTNRLVLVVPEKKPGEVESPRDLLKPSVKKVALAGESVPAGQYAEQVLRKLSLMSSLLSENKIVRGQDVRTALSYVERGEADAGIVYATDATVPGGVKVVYEFDAKLHDEIVYVLVALKATESTEAVDRFVKFLQSPSADAIYARFGFNRWTAAGHENQPAATPH